MIRTIIIEDEYFGQELIKKHIQINFPEIEVVGVESTVDPAIKLIKDHKPDLLLLDVQIHGGTGFDILNELKDHPFEIVFITAYSEYAIQAIKNNVCDYILKPIREGELIEALNKAIYKIKNKSLSMDAKSKIAINTFKGLEYIFTSDIIFLEADGPYTNVVFENKKILSTKNIGEFERILDKKNFFRTHNSYIINIGYVKTFAKGRSGTLVMINDVEIPVSQRRVKEFNQFLELK